MSPAKLSWGQRLWEIEPNLEVLKLVAFKLASILSAGVFCYGIWLQMWLPWPIAHGDCPGTLRERIWPRLNYNCTHCSISVCACWWWRSCNRQSHKAARDKGSNKGALCQVVQDPTSKLLITLWWMVYWSEMPTGSSLLSLQEKSQVAFSKFDSTMHCGFSLMYRSEVLQCLLQTFAD